MDVWGLNIRRTQIDKICVYQYNRHRFFNERLCGMVNSRIWICEEAVCGDEREHGAAFE